MVKALRLDSRRPFLLRFQLQIGFHGYIVWLYCLQGFSIQVRTAPNIFLSLFEVVNRLRMVVETSFKVDEEESEEENVRNIWLKINK